MSSGSLYNLTWGEYGTSLISAVQLLRCHDELVDVTLAAGGRTFHAHKVVLCAASPFLFDLLKVLHLILIKNVVLNCNKFVSRVQRVSILSLC